jgi:hypothetical protein
VPLVVFGVSLCGVMVSVFTETQYEYCKSSGPVVTTLSEVMKVPLVDAPMDTDPIAPVCSTVAEHVHPPVTDSTQMTEA